MSLAIRVMDQYDESSSWNSYNPQVIVVPAGATRTFDYPRALNPNGKWHVDLAVIEWHYVDAQGFSTWRVVKELNGIQYRWKTSSETGSCYLEFSDSLLEKSTSFSASIVTIRGSDLQDFVQRQTITILRGNYGNISLQVCGVVKSVSAPQPKRD